MIKKIIKKIVPKALLSILRFGLSLAYRIIKSKPKIITNFELYSVEKSETDTYFGYYDVSPFNSKNEVVYLEIPSESQTANVIFNDSTLKNPKLITVTHAWNWQQGSRLRWVPGSDNEIVFNDFINGNYVCRIFNIVTNEYRIICTPIYDISSDGKYGITLNFERLGVLRPGYGYTNKIYCDQYDLSKESIYLVDMLTGGKKVLLNYKTIANIMEKTIIDYRQFYINHLSFSPNGRKIMFFLIEIIGAWHKASLLVYDLNKKKATILEKELKVSHYAWRDDNSILCTVCDDSARCRFYLYNTGDAGIIKQSICPDILQWDGHPAYLTKNKILVDTYPNLYAFQQLFLMNLVTKEKIKLIEIYSKPCKKEEERTDLHPRLNKSKDIICFDANVYGKRRLYFLKGWN
jgi:hypothetical protein